MASNQMTDIVAPEVVLARHQITQFFACLETRGGIIGNRFVLFVYNANAPELSYITTEPTV